MKFIKNKYYRWYYQIVDKARKRVVPKIDIISKCYENHHIMPRCLGGTDDFWNLVYLTYKEHWVVHRLLLKITKGSNLKKMCTAFGALRMKRSGVRLLNSRQFAFARRQHRLGLIGTKHSEEFRKAASERVRGEKHPMYGKKHSEEAKDKIRIASLGENNHFYGKKHTDELKVRMSETKKGTNAGVNNPWYGKKHTEETRKIIKEKRKLQIMTYRDYPLLAEEYKRKISESMLGEKNHFFGKRHSEKTLKLQATVKLKHGKYSRYFPLSKSKCYCGCGEETSPGKRLIRGHWQRLSETERCSFKNATSASVEGVT